MQIEKSLFSLDWAILIIVFRQLDYFQGLKIRIVLGYTGILRVQYTAKLKMY